jgi:hypothetical protein
MYTRREFGTMTLAAWALPRALMAAVDSKVKGVRFGVQTYSFRELPRPDGGDAVDVIIKAMTECGLGECELWSPMLEPRLGPRFVPGGPRPEPNSPEVVKARAELRDWRVKTPIDHFTGIRKKFDAAGLKIYGFNYSFNPSFTDDEIDRGFQIAKALGAEIITASTTLPVAQKVAPFAEKHKMIVAMHGHSNLTDPNEFATPWPTCASTTPTSRTCTSRTARRTRATTRSGAKATRRSAKSCSSCRRTAGRSRPSSNTNTRARGRSKR